MSIEVERDILDDRFVGSHGPTNIAMDHYTDKAGNWVGHLVCLRCGHQTGPYKEYQEITHELAAFKKPHGSGKCQPYKKEM